MNEGEKKLAGVLAIKMAERDADAERSELLEKLNAQSRLRVEIFACVSRWTGIDVKPGDRIPIVRGGRQVGFHSEGLFGICPTERIANAAFAKDRVEITEKIETLTRISAALAELHSALASMPRYEREELAAMRYQGLSYAGDEVHSKSLEERLIKEIGVVNSLVISSAAFKRRADEEIENLNAELEPRSSRGRPRNEAAYAVALELARLYARVTGKRPTYSEGPDGVSGEFTPALKDAFLALGWKGRHLRGPAEKAIESILGDDLQPAENGGEGILSALLKP